MEYTKIKSGSGNKVCSHKTATEKCSIRVTSNWKQMIWIKNERFTKKLFSVQKKGAKMVQNEVVSEQYIFIYIYQSSKPSLKGLYKKRSINGKASPTGSNIIRNQSALLNLSSGDKQNDVVFINTKNNKENI